MTKRCENELIIIVKEIVADLMESIKLKKKQKLRLSLIHISEPTRPY